MKIEIYFLSQKQGPEPNHRNIKYSEEEKKQHIINSN